MGKLKPSSIKVPKDKIPVLIEELKQHKDITLIPKSKSEYEIFRAKLDGSLIIVYSTGSITYHESDVINDILLKYKLLSKKSKTKIQKTFEEIRVSLTVEQLVGLEIELRKIAEEEQPKSLGQKSAFRLDDSNIMLYNKGTVYSPKGHSKFEEAIIESVKTNPSFENFDIMIGQDEVGKGEIFGPMVVGSVALTEEQILKLQLKGVRDSKSVNEEDITKLAKDIINISTYCCTKYANLDSFNKRMHEMKNESKTINDFLAWTHSIALKDTLDFLSSQFTERKKLLLIIDEFDRIKTDQRIENKIKDYDIDVIQTPKAEFRSVAVASASILAKYARNNLLKELEEKFNCELDPRNLPNLLFAPFSNEIIKLSFARSALQKGTILIPTTTIKGFEADKIIKESLKKSSLESESIDYKEKFPKNATDVGKLLSAFSNTNGGVIFFGITDKTKDVVGLEDAQKVEERIQGLRKKLQPNPFFKIAKLITTDNKSILKVDVYLSKDEPISYDKKYYIRSGSTTDDISPIEMREYWKIRK